MSWTIYSTYFNCQSGLGKLVQPLSSNGRALVGSNPSSGTNIQLRVDPNPIKMYSAFHHITEIITMCSVVFFDGGYKGNHASFGIRLFKDGETHEWSGKRCATYAGSHEVLAFIETCVKLRELSISPTDVAIYTDDDFIAYAGLNLSNYRIKHESLVRLCKKYFPKDAYELSMAYLNSSRIHKVKSHSNVVDNVRVHYLARSAMSNKRPLSYDKWIKGGLTYWANAIEQRTELFKFANVNWGENESRKTLSESDRSVVQMSLT